MLNISDYSGNAPVDDQGFITNPLKG